jgi:hypothetical protein
VCELSADRKVVSLNSSFDPFSFAMIDCKRLEGAVKRITVLAVLALLVIPALAKTTKQISLKAHPKPNQQDAAPPNQYGQKDVFVREWDGSLDILAGVRSWDDHTISLVLGISNHSKEPQLFVPSQIVVILPNGHSYRPYSRDDELQAAEWSKKAGVANAYSGYNPRPVTTYTTDCSINGNTAYCRTTPDQSAQAGYAVGFALGAAIRSAVVKHTFGKYIKQIKDSYLVSQQIAPEADVMGYVDLFVEDIHNGPFTVRLSIPTTGQVNLQLGPQPPAYDFIFGPEVLEIDCVETKTQRCG